MALGRISGPLLKANLRREGVDLAFETDLLYLSVSDPDPSNWRIGIKNSSPSYELDVTGTIRSTSFRTTNLVVDEVVIDGNTITTNLGDLKLTAVNSSSNVVVATNLLPDVTNTYNFGSSAATWQSGYFNTLVLNSSITTGNIVISGNTISSTTGNIVIDPSGTNNLDVQAAINVTGDITTPTATLNVLNTSATTINFGGAATAVNIGATTGTLTLRNPTVVGSNATQTLWDTTATTINFGGAATAVNIGATTGTLTLRSATVVGSNATQNLWNTTATTINFGGAATAVNIGATTGTLTLKNATVVGSNTTQNLWNTTATTINFGGAATAVNIGATTGTTTVKNTLDVNGDLIVDGGDITTSATTFNLLNDTATTINLGGAATAVNIGATTGTTSVKNNLAVLGTATVTGQTTLSSVNVTDLTTNRILLAGTNGEISDSANLTFASNKLTVTGDQDVTGMLRLLSTSALALPVGTESDKSLFTPVSGQIRFNTTIGQFEGYQGAVWSSLGGVKSVDGLTYITPELTPGASDDTLRFYTNGILSLTLSPTKFSLSNNIVNAEILATTASTNSSSGALVVSGGAGIGGNLNVGSGFSVTASSGNTAIGGTLSVTGNSTVSGLLTANLGLTVAGSATPATEYFKTTNGTTDTFVVDTANGNTVISGTATISGLLNANAGIAVDTNKFTVADATGNTAIAGTLAVTGATTLSTVSATSGTFSGQITSTVINGTAPFVVASTTKVTNLNADLLDGFTTSATSTNDTVVIRTSTGGIASTYVELSGTSGSTTIRSETTASGTITIPSATDTLVGRNTTDTLTNKTLTNPVINGASGTLVLPQAITPAQTAEGSIVWDTDNDLLTVGTGTSRKTMVDTDSTQTLTNKTLTSPVITGVSPTVTLSGDVTGSGTLTNLGSVTITTTIAANSVALGTDTTGNYIATITGTTNQVNVTGSGVETAAVTLSLPQDIHTAATPTFAGATLDAIRVGITGTNEIDTVSGNLVIDSAGGTVTVDDDLIVSGNLTVQGTTVTVDSTVTYIVDPIVEIGGTPDGSPLTSNDGKDRGVKFNRFDVSAKSGFFGYDNSTGYFTFIPDATITNEVVSGTPGDILASTFRGNVVADSVTVSSNLQATGNVSLIPDASSSLTIAPSITGSINNVNVGNTTPGTGAFTTLSANSNVTFNGTNSTVTISPTGTGTVTIAPASTLTLGTVGVTTTLNGNISATATNQSINLSPAGTGTVTIAPATTVGNINRMNIGASVRGTGAFTTLTSNGATTFTANTASTSTTTGTLVVTGGVGVSGAIYAGSIQGTPIGSTTRSTGAFTTLTSNGATTFTANTASASTTTGTLVVTGGVGVSGAINSSSVKTDTLEHSGLNLTAGTNVDQMITVNVPLTLTTEWQDTGIKSTNLATGSYYMQIYANDSAVGGGHVDTYYSGIISWFAGTTTETTWDEIVLNRAGSAVGNGVLFVRLLRSTGSPDNLRLQLAGTTTNTGSATYTFKFRRLI